MEIRLKEHSRVLRIEVRGREGRGCAKPMPLATVSEPLAKVTVGKAEVVVIEEKDPYYHIYNQKHQNLESKVQEKMCG